MPVFLFLPQGSIMFFQKISSFQIECNHILPTKVKPTCCGYIFMPISHAQRNLPRSMQPPKSFTEKNYIKNILTITSMFLRNNFGLGKTFVSLLGLHTEVFLCIYTALCLTITPSPWEDISLLKGAFSFRSNGFQRKVSPYSHVRIVNMLHKNHNIKITAKNTILI